MATYSGPIFDVDVHHMLPDDADIVEYLPSEWRHLVRPGFSMMPPIYEALSSGSALRDDTVTDIGGPGGSHYETLRRQLLDGEYDDYRVLLTHQLGEFGGHANHYESRVLSRAANDWTIDAWLPRDKRMYSCVVVPLAEPQEAVKEIERVGDHPQMKGVLMTGNVLGRPLGDPLNHPIFEAAAERGLIIVDHVSGIARPTVASAAAGGRLSHVPLLALKSQQCQHSMSSLVVHGVFEKLPSLKVLFNEFAIGWLPSALFRLDDGYRMLRAESPWVKRLPSEYVLENIRFSTQPLEESFDDHNALFDMLRTIDGIEDILCFSSDYAHNAMDEPAYIARRLPSEWLEKVMCANACELLGLPLHSDTKASDVEWVM